MTRFTVPDMTCDGCVRAITGAIHAVDSAATVRVDLPSHRVDITSSHSEAALAAAIDGAGFTAQPAA